MQASTLIQWVFNMLILQVHCPELGFWDAVLPEERAVGGGGGDGGPVAGRREGERQPRWLWWI